MKDTEKFFAPEQITAFRETIIKNKFEVLLTDGDDTLWSAHTHFGKWLEAFYDYCVACRPEIKKDELAEKVRGINDDVCSRAGVAPSHWKATVYRLCSEYKLDEPVFINGIYIINEIYKTSGKIFEGVHETLDVFKACGLRLGLVTHAGRDWTDVKLRFNNLESVFEVKEIIDPESEPFKGPQHWKQAVEKFRVDSERVIAIGDNVNGDGWGAYNAGVRKIVILPSPWGKYREWNMPPGVQEANSFKEVISTLLRSA